MKMKTIKEISAKVVKQIPENKDLDAAEVAEYIKEINKAEDRTLAISDALGDVFRYGYYIGLDSKLSGITDDQLQEVDNDIMKAWVVAENALAGCNDMIDALTVEIIKDYLDHARDLLLKSR